MKRAILIPLLAATALLAPRLAAAQAAGCTDLCVPAGTPDGARLDALVITDAASLEAAEFGIGHVLGRILTTAGQPQSGNDLGDEARLMRTLLDTMAQTKFRLKESDIEVDVPRRDEAQLDAAALVSTTHADRLVPLALFNRIDQIPESAVHCGEHRIVYGMKSGAGTGRRFFLIFEAAIANPSPGDRSACVPLARHWEAIGAATGAKRAALLRELYFTGVDADGDSFPDFKPAIHYAHFGEPYGQVRSNMFVDRPWQLREWRVENVGGARFIADTVKDSAHGALWQDTDADAAMAQEQKRFRHSLMTQVGPRLFAPELASAAKPSCTLSDHERRMGFGAGVPARFNAARSDADFPNAAPPGDSPDTAGPLARSLFAGVTQSAAVLQPARPLTAQHAINRMEAMTCGGCHMSTAGQEIAGGSPPLLWPAALLFTHVDESRNLSPALLEVFLPARRCALDRLLDPEAGVGVASLADGEAISPQAAASIDALQRVQRLRQSIEADGAPFGPAAAGPAAAVARGLRSSIEAARALEREEPGAVVPVRRTHG